MSKRLIVSNLMILVMGLVSLPFSNAQVTTQSSSIKVSEYRDDPFVAESYIGRMDAERFGQDEAGKPFMSGDRVSMIGETYLYRENPTTHQFAKFAFNPWPKDGRSNNKGNFRFTDEPRFPI